MKYNISKELFEAVAKIEVDYFKVDNWSVNYNNTYIKINDFFFQCREWALEQGYSHLSGKDDIYGKGKNFVCSVGSSKILIKDFYADSEQQAVFDACQWILENKDRL